MTKKVKEKQVIQAFSIPADIHRKIEKEAEKKDRCNRSRTVSRILASYFSKDVVKSATE